MVNIKNVEFWYRQNEIILNNISFKANSNNPIAILGPSGCGKTTLLKCIYGTLKPSNGSILIDNNTPNEARNNKRIGVAFQESALIQWKTVKDNITFPNSIGKQKMTIVQAEEQFKEIPSTNVILSIL